MDRNIDPIVAIDKSLGDNWFEGAELGYKYVKDKEKLDTIVSYYSYDNKRKQLDFLLDHGSDPTNGVIAAFNKEQYETVKYLISRGAKYREFFEWLYQLNDKSLAQLNNILIYAGKRIPLSDLEYLKDKIKEWSNTEQIMTIRKTIGRLIAEKA